MGGDNLNIEYHHNFGLPRRIVWKYIKDEMVLKNSIPNCRSFRESSRGVYQAEIDIHFGPVRDLFTLEVRIVREMVPSIYQLRVKGKGKIGEIKGTAILQINEVQGASKLTVKAGAEVTGTLAAAKELVFTGGRNMGIEKFFQTVEKEIRRKLYVQRRGKS